MIVDVVGLKCNRCKTDFGNFSLSSPNGPTPEELIAILYRMNSLGVKPLCNECLGKMSSISYNELEKMK
jgi:hypothetical protein